MDVYKGVCILFVIVTHYAWTLAQRKALLFPFWIDMAVPVFMVITGYLSAMAFQKQNQSLGMAYRLGQIIGKWLRFVIPFIGVFILEVLVRMAMGRTVTFAGLLKSFVTGGSGPGAYYFPVMLQVVLVMPIICCVVRRFDIKGLIGCFAANGIFELVQAAIGLPVSIYRICALRYVFILGFGCFLYVRQQANIVGRKHWYYLAGLVGLAYLIVFKYTSVEPIIIPKGWISTSVIGVLFIVPAMLYLMTPNKLHCAPIELLGKASFNIFLVQMCYYWGLAHSVYRWFPRAWMQLLASLVICCACGILFYKIESPFTQKMVIAIRKRNS